MDVLFVTPASRKKVYQDLAINLAAIEVPVWSGLLANVIRKKNYKTAILDAEALGLDALQTAIRISEYEPKIVAFVVYGQQPSASTQCMPAAMEACAELKKINSEIKTIAIGTHPSALPEKTLRDGPFDFVCEGEGPNTVLDLLQATQHGEDFSTVRGLWFFQNGEVKKGPRSQNIQNLDKDLPGIAWDFLDMKAYRAHNWHCFDDIEKREPYASLPTSLGCPYHCAFCCINAPFGKSGIRYWSVDFITAQIDLLVEKFGIKNIKIPDEMFVLNERHVLGICEHIIEKKYDLNIWAYARVDTVKDHFLPYLKKAGFRWLALGIESGSSYVRNGMEKGRFNNDQITQTVRKVQEAGIYVCGNYIFGLPDDTLESMQATLTMAKSLNTEWANFYCAMAYPGSNLYREAIVKNIPLPDSWIGFSQHSYECLPLPTNTLSSAEVLEFRDNAFLDYYLSPNFLEQTQRKFGDRVVAHVREMCSKSMERKILSSDRWVINFRAYPTGEMVQ